MGLRLCRRPLFIYRVIMFLLVGVRLDDFVCEGLLDATLSSYSKIQGILFLNFGIVYPLCFTSVSRLNVDFTLCFTIRNQFRASKGGPKGNSKGGPKGTLADKGTSEN